MNADLLTFDEAYEEMDRIRVQPVETEHECPKCGAKMLLREGRYGQFLGCSNYPDCDGILRLDREGKPISGEAEETEHKCPECGETMLRVEGRWGPYLRCSRHPDCSGRMKLDRQGQPVAASQAKPTSLTCDKCGSPMVLRTSRRGPFLGCSAYPKCRNLRRIDEDVRAKLAAEGIEVPASPAGGPGPQETPIPCSECGKPMVLRTSRRGPFLGCSGYPTCRNTLTLTDEVRAMLTQHGLDLT